MGLRKDFNLNLIRNNLLSGLLISIHLLYRICPVETWARVANMSAGGQIQNNYEKGNNSLQPRQGQNRENKGGEGKREKRFRKRQKKIVYQLVCTALTKRHSSVLISRCLTTPQWRWEYLWHRLRWSVWFSRLSFTDASSGSGTIGRFIRSNRSKVEVKIQRSTYKQNCLSVQENTEKSAKNTSLYSVVLWEVGSQPEGWWQHNSNTVTLALSDFRLALHNHCHMSACSSHSYR